MNGECIPTSRLTQTRTETHRHNFPMPTDQQSLRSQERAQKFGEREFPQTWKDWDGIGPESADALRAKGVSHPLHLLGHFLMINQDASSTLFLNLQASRQRRFDWNGRFDEGPLA